MPKAECSALISYGNAFRKLLVSGVRLSSDLNIQSLTIQFRTESEGLIEVSLDGSSACLASINVSPHEAEEVALPQAKYFAGLPENVERISRSTITGAYSTYCGAQAPTHSYCSESSGAVVDLGWMRFNGAGVTAR